jgi:hypothetical protein
VDWPVVASNVFMWFATAALVGAPIVGNHGGWRRVPAPLRHAAFVLPVISLSLLMFSWRAIPGGFRAALFGHAALTAAVITLVELGRIVHRAVDDRLNGALIALVAGAVLVIGVFAAGPLAGALSPTASTLLLGANPLVAVTSAAGIDLLHLDAIYRTSPLAHRGVALPAWTTACAVYAVVGLAAHGMSRLRPWSRSR